MKSQNAKSLSALFKTSLLALAGLAGAANAELVTIPETSLNSSPGVYTPGGYYTDSLGSVVVMTGGGNQAGIGDPSGRNDDGFSYLNLGFNVNFFGTTYSSLYINNNGSVSFGKGIAEYVPTGPTGAAAPLISAFFGDVDTRNAGSGVVKVNTSVADQLVVTWDKVGRYNNKADLLDSFQLVLRGVGYSIPTGEGAIGFFYSKMQWDVTETSQVAAVGFGDGLGNGEVIAGSTSPGMNNVVNDKYIWFNANREVVVPTDVPEPGSLPLLVAALVGAGWVTRKNRRS